MLHKNAVQINAQCPHLAGVAAPDAHLVLGFAVGNAAKVALHEECRDFVLAFYLSMGRKICVLYLTIYKIYI